MGFARRLLRKKVLDKLKKGKTRDKILEEIDNIINLVSGVNESFWWNVLEMVPIAGDVCTIVRGIKKGEKVKDWINRLDKKIDNLIKLQKKSAQLIAKVLKNFKERNIKIGNQSILISKERMKHFLERHHPKFWDGSTKTVQTFLNKNMSVDDVADTITNILKQNGSKLMNGEKTISGIVNGVKYQLKVDGGKVVQFFPL